MYKTGAIIDWMNEKFPPETAEEYDNPGIMCGSASKDVNKLVISLDLTSRAVSLAKEKGAQMLITHHPVIFGGIDNVNEDLPHGRLLSQLIRENITCFAAHTNLDKAQEYSNAILADILGATSFEVPEDVSCGVVALFDEMKLSEFMAETVKALDSSGAISINDPDRKVSKVFVQGGAFDEESIPALLRAGVDTVVSGEIKHHITLLLEEYGIASVIAGHNATERVFMPNLANELYKAFPELEIFVDNGNERILN